MYMLFQRSILYINIFIVNNYEISEWESYYLTLWNRNQSIHYVEATTLLGDLELLTSELLCKYFSIMSNNFIYI